MSQLRALYHRRNRLDREHLALLPAVRRADVTAEAIMDRVVHNTVWVSAGDINMREHYAKKDRGPCSQDAQGRAD